MIWGGVMRYWFVDWCWMVFWAVNRCVRCRTIMRFTFVFYVSNKTVGVVSCISYNLGTTIWKSNTVFTTNYSIFILSLLFVKICSCVFIGYTVCVCKWTRGNFVGITMMFRCWWMVGSRSMGKQCTKDYIKNSDSNDTKGDLKMFQVQTNF